MGRYEGEGIHIMGGESFIIPLLSFSKPNLHHPEGRSPLTSAQEKDPQH